MARIPLGEFDQVRVQAPVRTGTPDLSGATAGARAQGQLGQQIVGMAERGMQIHQQREAQQQQEDDALTRVKALNAAAEDELRIRQAAADVQQGLATGEVSWADAPEKFQTAVSNIQPAQVDGMNPVIAESYNGAIRQNRMSGNLLIDSAVRQAKGDDGRAQWGATLDKFGKLAGQPGADIAKINATIRATIPTFQKFGLDPAVLTKQAQDFADKNWTNQAAQRFNAGHDDMAQLQALQHDLTDDKGAYADKLDADKRNAIAAQVGNRIDSLQAKAEHAADRADAIADRTLAKMDEQFATGIPATPEQWASWADVFKDSSRKAEFTARVQDERDIQTFLRQPIEQQLAGIQQRQAALQAKGGDAHAIANFGRLKSAVDANVKMLREQPLQFASARMAQPVEPLDLQALATGQGGAIGAQLAQRQATITAMRKQYGPQVQDKLLLPQEAGVLTAVLDKMPAEAKLSTFAQLHQLSGSDSAYTAIMQQLAPDSPVTARAGELAAIERKFTPDRGTVSSNVALTMLKGEALLNKTKGDKAADGKAAPYPMPSDDKFRAEFNARVGNAFAGRPGLYEARYQQARAYYAGRTAEQGLTSDQLDPRLAGEAVTATMGRMVDFNGRTVAAPWGMDEGDFKDAAETAMHVALRDLPDDIQRNTVNAVGLMQVADGLYVMVSGRTVVLDAAGNPRIVRVAR